MSKFDRLKEISIQMGITAHSLLNVDSDFSKQDGIERDLAVYSLFNHGMLAMGDKLKAEHGIDVNDLVCEKEK